jgi:hypothetical protein
MVHLSNKTIRRPPESHETIPINRECTVVFLKVPNHILIPSLKSLSNMASRRYSTLSVGKQGVNDTADQRSAESLTPLSHRYLSFITLTQMILFDEKLRFYVPMNNISYCDTTFRFWF